jgi:hypothetical protein
MKREMKQKEVQTKAKAKLKGDTNKFEKERICIVVEHRKEKDEERKRNG